MATSMSSTAPQSVWLEKHPRLGVSLMDHLWNRMDGTYPNRWRAAFANEQAIENWREAWADAFSDERITPDEVRSAIAVCRKTYDWPPSLPEFLKACRPPMDYEYAFYAAVDQMRLREMGRDTWPSPAIFWAAVSLGGDLLARPYQGLQTRWKKALDDATEAVRSGAKPATVPPRLVALPSPGKTVPSREKIEANIARLRAMVGAVAMAKTVDGGQA